MKKISLVCWLAYWLLWIIFAGVYFGKYFQISKKFPEVTSNFNWRIWTAKSNKLNFVFPDAETEKNFKRYLPPVYKSKKPEGKFFFLNGTNGWHHLTKKFLDDFYPEDDFILVLIDAHPDAAPLTRDQKINCGNWVNFIRQPVILVGGAVGFDEEVNRFLNSELIARGKLQLYPAKSFSFYLKSQKKIPARTFPQILCDHIAKFFGAAGYYVTSYSLDDFYSNGPVRRKIYISIDLDVLNSNYIRTDFGSGLVSLSELLKLLDFLSSKNEIIGLDICGITKNSDEKSLKTWQKIFTSITSPRVNPRERDWVRVK